MISQGDPKKVARDVFFMAMLSEFHRVDKKGFYTFSYGASATESGWYDFVAMYCAGGEL